MNDSVSDTDVIPTTTASVIIPRTSTVGSVATPREVFFFIGIF